MEKLINAVAVQRRELLMHPLYENLSSLEDFQVFMESHVYAVWDFMSLLKALQLKLTGMNLPWMPAKDPTVARLINDIVLAEETDEDGRGGFCSHFELYLTAMKDAGASTAKVDEFLKLLSSGRNLDFALGYLEFPDYIGEFLRVNYKMSLFGKPHEIAASFTLGREDLIPDLFRKLVEELVKNRPGELTSLAYYFDRHIHLDEEEHGPLAWRMVELLIEDDGEKFNEAVAAAKEALQVRKTLWDGINQTLISRKILS